jgi:hypothetical protein
MIMAGVDAKKLARLKGKLGEPSFKPAWKYVGSAMTDDEGRALASYIAVEAEKHNVNFEPRSASSTLASMKNYANTCTRTFSKRILNGFIDDFVTAEGLSPDREPGLILMVLDSKSELLYERAGTGGIFKRNLGLNFLYRGTARLDIQLLQDKDVIFALSLPKGATEVDATWKDPLTLAAFECLRKAIETGADVERKVLVIQDGHFTAVKKFMEDALALNVTTGAHHTGSDRIVRLSVVPGDPTRYGPTLKDEITFGMLSTTLCDSNKTFLSGFVRRAFDCALTSPVRINLSCKDNTKGNQRLAAVRTELNRVFDAAKGQMKIVKGAFSRTYELHDVAAHEMGHSLFIPHAVPEPGAAKWRHTQGYSCLMNYTPDKTVFCAVCNVALRGWDIGNPKDKQGGQVATGSDIQAYARAKYTTLLLGPGPAQQRIEVVFRCVSLAAYDGFGFIASDNTGAVLYDAPVGGTAVPATQAFDAEDMLVGVTLYAEPATAGTTTFTLQLRQNDQVSRPTDKTATETVNVVQASIEVAPDGTSPALSADAQHTAPGCAIVVQNPAKRHPRAKLVIKRQPATSKLALTLRVHDGSSPIELYEKEKPPAKGEEKKLLEDAAYRVDMAKGAERALWIEGREEAPGDVRLDLVVEGAQERADHAFLDVNALLEMSADVPVTPPKTIRPLQGSWNPSAGKFPWKPYEAPLPDNKPTRAAFHANGESLDMTQNLPLVVLTGSASATPATSDPSLDPLVTPILLRVPNVVDGLKWVVTRAGDDHGNIAALGPNPLPILRAAPSGAAGERELLTDAVGSFHVRCFVDADDTGVYQPGASSIVLNVVMVKASLVADGTVLRAAVGGCAAHRGEVFAYSQRTIKQGFSWGDEVPIEMRGTVDLVGGGADGKRGLDRIGAGWVNNIVHDNAGAVYAGGGTAGAAQALYLMNATPVEVSEAKPLLDKAPKKVLVGKEIFLSESQTRDGAILALGKQLIVETIDAPQTSWDITNPTNPALKIRQISQLTKFRGYLTLFTASVPELYGVLLEKHWNFEADYYVDESGPVTSPAPKKVATVSVVNSVTHAPLATAAAIGIEVRTPTGLTLQVPRVITDGDRTVGQPWEAP